MAEVKLNQKERQPGLVTVNMNKSLYRQPDTVSIIIISDPIHTDWSLTQVNVRVWVIKIVIVINCNLITFSKVIASNCN